jgi:alpha-1,3-rhamnosyl/mannosyltransferase
MSILAIDASSANKDQRSGVEWYAFHLIQAMKTRALAEGERVVLFSPTPLVGPLGELPAGWESKVLKWWLPMGWMKGRVGWELLRHAPSVFFVPAQGLPLFGKNLVATIHDIGFRHVPMMYDPKQRRVLERTTRTAVRRSKRIFAVSEFTKREVVDGFPGTLVPLADRIDVVPNAVNADVYKRLDQPDGTKVPGKDVASVLQKHRLGRHFFLYVGRMDAKKNVKTLIRAFELFKQGRGTGDPFELVLVGSPGYKFFEIKQYVEHSPSKSSIRYLGYLPDDESAALMNAATAFAFPSWYEGFGVPPLEAAACGCPLIVSDISAHREVLADAAIFVAPGEPENWAAAMREVVTGGSGAKEANGAKGFARVAAYSWEKSADVVLEALRSLV